MPSELIFYDIATKPPTQCLSHNLWKIRLALNYKQIPYRTHWIPYTQITPTLKSLGLPPNDPTKAFTAYSCPAVTLPSGEHIMESSQILPELEKLKPEPSLHLDSEYIGRVQAIVEHVQFIRPMILPVLYRIPDWWMEGEDSAAYHAAREKTFGRTLYEIAADPKNDEAEQGAEERLMALRDLLAENPEGPFCLGTEVSYADFIIVGILKLFSMLDQDGDLYGRVIKADRRFRELEKACEARCQRNDH